MGSDPVKSDWLISTQQWVDERRNDLMDAWQVQNEIQVSIAAVPASISPTAFLNSFFSMVLLAGVADIL